MNSQKHELSDEQFAELLAGTDGAASDDGAGAEAFALRSALRSYRVETLQWAERRSSTQPSLQPAARRSRFWAGVPQWSLAAVAVISIAAGVAHVYAPSGDAGDETLATTQGTVAADTVVRTSEADIADDNRLLSSIDQALSYHTVPPIDSLGLKPTHSTKTPTPGVID
jgi:hypothetical protein